MKRRLVVLLLLLVGGAIVNVAVAWGCAILTTSNPRTEYAPDDEARAVLSRYVMVGTSGLEMVTGARMRAFGVSQLLVSLKEPDFESPDPTDARECLVYWYHAGWPVRSLRDEAVNGVVRIQTGWLRTPTWAPRMAPPYLPTVPIWPGFAFNTLFYATLLWLPFGAFAMRTRSRIRRGLCPKCAYDLRGTTGVVCPECGAAVNTIAR